ncbi:ATP-binding protein [Streptomyces sp. NPDC056222]|uniref:ATP-binding protein n=1 Tax=Streptomyces sp. NPDC056222 TaxID=3345749 RepID=UPI0035D7E4C4
MPSIQQASDLGTSEGLPCSILDDFTMRQLNATQADDVYELVYERQGRSLIITSNRAPSDWYPLFPNPVVAESLLDQDINTSHQVFMNGPS